MKADLEGKKLFLFYENDLERSKLFDFLIQIADCSETGIELGTLQMSDPEDLRIGLFLRALIPGNLTYLQERSEVLHGS